MRTLQQQLIEKLGVTPKPIQRQKKKDKTTKEVICSYPPIGKLTHPTKTTVITRESTDPRFRNNGGDYDMGYDATDRFCFGWSSCDFSSSNSVAYGGYYRGRPLIAIVEDSWGTEFAPGYGVQLRFPDGGFHNCDHKEWEKIVNSEYWECIDSSSEGVTFRED